MKRRAWPLALTVAWAYGGVALAYAVSEGVMVAYTPVLVWVAGVVVLCLANIVYALSRKTVSALPGMVAKLLLIPFYVISFFMGVMLFIAPPAVIIIFLLDGLYVLATSAYTLRGVYLGWRGGRLSAGWAIALAIIQCIFVLDVLGSIAIYAIEKRRSH